MGIFQGLGKAFGATKELDVDEFMTAAEAEHVDVMHEETSAYVKPITLQVDGDIKLVEEELNKKNLVLLNITAYARNPAKLKTAVGQLRQFASAIGGDIARIDEDKILLTPANVKIVKKTKQRQ